MVPVSGCPLSEVKLGENSVREITGRLIHNVMVQDSTSLVRCLVMLVLSIGFDCIYLLRIAKHLQIEIVFMSPNNITPFNCFSNSCILFSISISSCRETLLAIDT